MAFKIILLFLATIVAFWMSAICGGGASLILVPVINLLLPTAVVPFSLTVGTLSSSSSRIIVFHKAIRWDIVWWFVPFSIPAVLLGAWLLKFINPLYLQLFVALFLMANIPELFRSKSQLAKEEKQAPKFILAVVGFFAGFVSGITGAIGLLFNRFYLRYGLTKEEIVATRAANEIVLHVIKLCIYIVLGLYTQNALWLGLTIAAGAVLSSYTVRFILPLLSEVVFRKIGYAAMAVSGLFLLIDTTGTIYRQDRIALGRNQYDEAIVNWRDKRFVLEFALGDGLEVERPIGPNELPLKLQSRYTSLKSNYDAVFLEKVYKAGSKRSYEFYCYQGKQLTKLEFEE